MLLKLSMRSPERRRILISIDPLATQDCLMTLLVILLDFNSTVPLAKTKVSYWMATQEASKMLKKFSWIKFQFHQKFQRMRILKEQTKLNRSLKRN
jgi:hypothetical protein